MEKRLNIALLAGGNSSEREIALQSAAQIYEALDKERYNIFLIDLNHRDWSYTAPDGSVWQVDKNDFSITVKGKTANTFHHCDRGREDFCITVRRHRRTRRRLRGSVFWLLFLLRFLL